MKNKLLSKLSLIPLLLFILMASAQIFAEDISLILKNADEMNESQKYEEARILLFQNIKNAAGNKEKAEIYWRISREYLNLGDLAEENGREKSKILEIFETGEQYAEIAINSDPENCLGYFWKSANIGRWGEVKGIFESLAKAKDMRDLLEQAIKINPRHADSFYVLGILYDAVPGIISFGNKNYAVSLGKKAIVLMEEECSLKEIDIDYSYYVEYAYHLYERNWSQSKRDRKQKNKASSYYKSGDILEKNFYFEGITELLPMSDREEALKIIKDVIIELESIVINNPVYVYDLNEAKQVFLEWED